MNTSMLCGLLLSVVVGCESYKVDNNTIALFDGASLTGWKQSGSAKWQVVNGELGPVDSSADSMLVSESRYDNFRLSLEFQVDEKVNSGIFIRCNNAQNISPDACYEINIWDRHPQPEMRTGAIVKYVMPPLASVDTIGKWNVCEILANGDRITARVNGAITAELRDDTHSEGFIALQSAHSGQVRFKNITIELR